MNKQAASEGKADSSQSAQQAREDTAAVKQATETVVMPVLEETFLVGKKVVETGTVRLTKKVHQQEVDVNVPLMQEEHQVEHVPVNQYVETAPGVRYEGDTMIIPILKEEVEVVLRKRLLLVEELHVTKRQVHSQVTQTLTLRSEEVLVERESTQPAAQEPFPSTDSQETTNLDT